MVLVVLSLFTFFVCWENRKGNPKKVLVFRNDFKLKLNLSKYQYREY